ncbi:alpha/beta hydrolase [Desulfonema ishimotonii]|uniref:Alpha/beta hydrolase n=1 Tax=Desulfonema ishimotonii TaxID=45657 RepID=A0A401FSU0_9BACT|nr:alpha/beta fold hydrolase [Desulfonema ishimotonii]GBC60025.1 alpha/beta hydrolase [Desulfonema ishimotonii]
MAHKKVDISGFRHLYPFRSHFLKMNGLNYHYLDEGAGEPVVMLHGNPTWSFYYRNVVKALAPGYRAIVPDHMGCGLSDKPDLRHYDYRLRSRIDDLERLLDHLGITERITLMVHDWGGMIGMAYALRHPERISRLIITNTSAFLPPGNKRLPFRLWLIRNIMPFGTPAVLGLNLFARGALHMAPHKRLPADVRAGLTAPYNCPANRMATLKFVQDIPLIPGDPGYEIVRHVDDTVASLSHLPMLICWGQHDFVFDTDYLAEWRRRFPHADAHLFSDAGHYLLEDKADRVIGLVKEFLKKNTA